MRIQGKIVRLVTDRGFGFVESLGENPIDYFIHMKQVQKDSVPFRHFTRGDILEFDAVTVEGKGPQAHNIRKLIGDSGVSAPSTTE